MKLLALVLSCLFLFGCNNGFKSVTGATSATEASLSSTTGSSTLPENDFANLQLSLSTTGVGSLEQTNISVYAGEPLDWFAMIPPDAAAPVYLPAFTISGSDFTDAISLAIANSSAKILSTATCTASAGSCTAELSAIYEKMTMTCTGLSPAPFYAIPAGTYWIIASYSNGTQKKAQVNFIQHDFTGCTVIAANGMPMKVDRMPASERMPANVAMPRTANDDATWLWIAIALCLGLVGGFSLAQQRGRSSGMKH
jgi:hypothetical protein